jgi:hypothetical protein
MRVLGPSLQLAMVNEPLTHVTRLLNGMWVAAQDARNRRMAISLCLPDGRLLHHYQTTENYAAPYPRHDQWWNWADPWGTKHIYQAESIKLPNHYAHVVYEDKDTQMQAVVNATFPVWIRGYEGECNWLYPDTHTPPLPTTGTGNQIGDGKGGISPFGLSLPWRKVVTDGRNFPSQTTLANAPWATEAEIKAEWQRLLSLDITGSGFAYKRYATLWLEQSVVDFLLFGKMDANWNSLTSDFPEADLWPADAQLAIQGMAWWMGPNFWERWPRLTMYLNGQNFYGAAANAISVEHADRDYDHQHLFTNAGAVAALSLNRGVLWLDGTPKVTIGTTNFLTLSQLDASELKAADVNSFDLDGWYGQRMLEKLGFYTLVVDGEFGPRSRTAYNNFCKSKTLPQDITQTTLSALSQASKYYLPVIA